MKIETVAIIGAGSIGGTVAFGLLANDDRFHIKEILLVDMSADITQAQVNDLADASLEETVIRGATFKEAGKSDLIILAADTPPIDKEPKEKWLHRSQKFITGIATSMSPIQSNAYMIVAVEPVDMFVSQLLQLTTLKAECILGVGHTAICNRRMHAWFKEYQSGLKVSSSVFDSEPWVIGTARFPLVIWPEVKQKQNERHLEELKKRWVGTNMFQSCLIKDKKGDAWFGTSASVIALVKVLLHTDPSYSVVLLVSTFHSHLGICTSLPAIITNSGVKSTLSIPISDAEQRVLVSTTMDYYQV